MIIGVSINGVIRDHIGSVRNMYRKYFPFEPCEVRSYDDITNLPLPDEIIRQKEVEFDHNFSGDVESIIVSETVTVENEVSSLTDMFYVKFPYEIYGLADEVDDFNVFNLNGMVSEFKNHDFMLLSSESGKGIPATYYFLSKTTCGVETVKFTKELEECWKHVDVMITDRPEIINSKPDGKIVVKVIRPFNIDLKSDYEINSINEISKSNFINIL